MHAIAQDDSLYTDKQDKQDRNFVAVRIKYIQLDSIKSVMFTKLKSSASQR